MLAPLFSLYSRDSLGIGDFSDIKLLVDFCRRSGLRLLQFLPLNEVGANFCPYEAISSFALEPMFLSPRNFFSKKAPFISTAAREIQQRYPAGSSRVDYRVKAEKLALFKEIWQQRGPARELEDFIQRNSYWLLDFALYKALKDYHRGAAWYEWPDEFRKRDSSALKIFQERHRQEVDFQLWLQWQLYRQLKEAADYARSKEVIVKGDLPILVSRDSADVWQHPEFFRLELAAGAPPDVYCAKGQRWGMPTYNWEAIAADGYRYLKEKLRYAQGFYDALRIDHVVGLFRIWSIPYQEPLENQGLNGFFDPPQEEQWLSHGRGLLSVMLSSTEMLLCAEDLGVIPLICPQALYESGIPGNDVQRWTKDWQSAHDFLSPPACRRVAVTMLSTHDTTNFAAWWEDEAGTIDAELFARICRQRQKEPAEVSGRLFDPGLSRRGRLRWRSDLDSPGALEIAMGGKGAAGEELINLYLNSFREKEKFWRYLGLSGSLQEKCSRAIAKAALQANLDSAAIFAVQTIIDWLYLGGLLKAEPYLYRINYPGRIGAENWSLTLPLALEELLQQKLCAEIKAMLVSARRL